MSGWIGGVDGASVVWHSARTSQGTGTRRVWADGSKFNAVVARMIHVLDDVEFHDPGPRRRFGDAAPLRLPRKSWSSLLSMGKQPEHAMTVPSIGRHSNYGSTQKILR